MMVQRKRQASELAREASKRARLEPDTGIEDDEHDDAYDSPSTSEADDTDSEEDDGDSKSTRTGTPATPFSPRPKFPSELKTLKCTYDGCTKAFNRPVRLEAHLRSHKNERPFACDHEGCDKTYIQEKHLKQHIKGTHLHEKTYGCDWEGCGKSFLTGQRLRRHMLVHEGHERFRCSAYAPCKATFRKHQTVQRHIRSVHLGLPEFPCTHVDSETSVACGAAFDSAGSLRRHIERIHGDSRFICDECSGEVDENGVPQKVGFSTNAQLTAHVRDAHANCIFCPQRCSSQQALQKHIEARHSGMSVGERKKVLCTYPGCGKRFVKTANLNAHIRSAHEGEKFVCGEYDLQDTAGAGSWDGQDACGSHFASKANLVDHVRTQHMGLPSTINAGRIKGTGRNGAAKRKPKEPSAIEELTGQAYDELQGRNILCTIEGCPYKFFREYDLEVHLKSKHATSDEQISVPDSSIPKDFTADFGTGIDIADEQSYNHFANGEVDIAANSGTNAFDPFEGDLEWQIQRQAEQGGVFWIGAVEDELEMPDEDERVRDEREMRALIGGGGMADYGTGMDDGGREFWDAIDPRLR